METRADASDAGGKSKLTDRVTPAYPDGVGGRAPMELQLISFLNSRALPPLLLAQPVSPPRE